MPPEQTTVLVCDDKFETKRIAFAHTWNRGELRVYWYKHEEHHHLPCHNVSYWMPLPELPL